MLSDFVKKQPDVFNFFIPYFIYLFLEVFYVTKFLQKSRIHAQDELFYVSKTMRKLLFANSFYVCTFAANLKQGIFNQNIMALNTLKHFLLLTFFSAFSVAVMASETKDENSGERFDPKEMIMHHVKDAYGMHILTLNEGKENETHITIPLPIILWTDNGLVTFMSSEFHHDYDGNVVVEKDGKSSLIFMKNIPIK